MIKNFFKKILPKYGFKLRKQQLKLSENILETIKNNTVLLAEAEVGIGKTMAYLVSSILAKRYGLNSKVNETIIIATSSIALQSAIMTDYIPKISRILLENKLIETPIKAVLRKGKEHYLCRQNLEKYMQFRENNKHFSQLKKLSGQLAIFDLDKISYLPKEIKEQICVGSCNAKCKHFYDCEYQKMCEKNSSSDVDIQVCNHNYLLVDTIHRSNGLQNLLPDYQILIIDEAHKFLQASQTMYGFEFENTLSSDLLRMIYDINFKSETCKKSALDIARKINSHSTKMFKYLLKNSDLQEQEKRSICFDETAEQYLEKIFELTEKLQIVIYDEVFYEKAFALLQWIRTKYHISISQISLKNILIPTHSFFGKNQSFLQKTQLTNLYKMICENPKIKLKAEEEFSKRQQMTYRKNPEQIVLKSSSTPIYDEILYKTKQIMIADNLKNCNSEQLIKIVFHIKNIREKVELLTQNSKYICWIEKAEKSKSDNNFAICGVPKNIGEILFEQQWSKNIPTVFTSGTLSANGDFSRIKEQLGLQYLGEKVTQTRYSSPFDYAKNCMIYISENTENPNGNLQKYITSIANEIEKLVQISNGHAAVLFTSYDTMGRVYADLKARNIAFHMFKLDKSTSGVIGEFKRSKNGILFASGALWEGIDISGDTLSMLIIVKLPFQNPDPICEFEQSKFEDFSDYKNAVIVPEMLIKLNQGFGRLIRSESDTGIVALLDSRCNSCGNYRDVIVDNLPKCTVTSQLEGVSEFFRSVKSAEYFE